jgi:hypothetical protein
MQSPAVGATKVGEHEALEGAHTCRARIRSPAELDARATFKIGMMNLGYNIRRLVQLERMAAAAA